MKWSVCFLKGKAPAIYPAQPETLRAEFARKTEFNGQVICVVLEKTLVSFQMIFRMTSTSINNCVPNGRAFGPWRLRGSVPSPSRIERGKPPDRWPGISEIVHLKNERFG